jgi:branched-chain amino acid transport system substrate-binding protein
MTQRRQFLGLTAGSGVALAAGGLALPAHATQGVSKTEIVVGSLQDLSGPVAGLGKPIQNGMILRTEQVNAAGGINGRKLKLVIEDMGYDPKKAVLGAQKLLSQDKIFAMIGTLGSPTSLATIPLVLDKGVAHLFPITSHHGNFDPFHKLKFAMPTPYPISTRVGLLEMIRQKGFKRVAILYQDDEYGLEVLRGAEAALKQVNLPLVEKTSYKRGATDFSSQMQRIKAANPDLIVLGTVIRETIGSMAAARQLGYTGEFFGSHAAYMPVVAKAGGKAVEGLYAVMETPTPYRDDPNNPKLLNEWLDAYKARFNEDADLYSVIGWMVLDIFVRAAERAGPNLTTDTLVAALEKNPYPRGFFGNPDLSWGPNKRLGNSQVKLAQIQNGRWRTISDFLKDDSKAH